MSVNWLYEDAIFMKKEGRLRGCLLLLLCKIDEMAQNKDPSTTSNKVRYTTFLQDKLRLLNLDQTKISLTNGLTTQQSGNYDNREMCTISDIIYHEFRCCIVHEGDSREEFTGNLVIDYNKPYKEYNFSETDTVNLGGLHNNFGDPEDKWTIDAHWIICLLITVINN